MNTINKIFNDNVYVIYIPQREKYIKDVFKKMKIKANFIPAILIDELPSLNELLNTQKLSPYFFKRQLKYEGYPIDLIKYEEKKDENTIKFIRGLKGKLALQLSYLKVFDIVLNKKNNENCIIFEDDILYPKNINLINKRFENIFEKELKNINWDYINLGRCFDLCKINTKFSENLIIDTYPLCTHSCCLSKKVMEELILISLPLNEPGDHIILNNFYLNPKYKCFSTRPALFYQNKTFISTLGNPNRELPECSK